MILEMMLYPARWKGITVDQSKVLKKSTVWGGGGHPVYMYNCLKIAGGGILFNLEHPYAMLFTEQ